MAKIVPQNVQKYVLLIRSKQNKKLSRQRFFVPFPLLFSFFEKEQEPNDQSI